MDPLVSFIRLLVGDNSRTSPFYTDAQILASATIGARPSLPIDLRMSGLVGYLRFPLNPPASSEDVSLAALTDEQLASLTDDQLASMVD